MCLCDCLEDLRCALLQAKKQGTEIELLTAAPPPAGRPPNIRGIIKKVRLGIIELELSVGPPGRIAVFSICQIIGFVPTNNNEEATG